MGTLRLVIIGLILGLAGATTWAASETTLPCTNANVESQFQEVKRLDDTMGSSNAPPRSFVRNVDHIWGRTVDCNGSQPGLSQEEHSKYLDILLIGNGDSVYVYYDAKRYADARKHLDAYLATAGSIRPIAKAKGWSGWLNLEGKVTPVMHKYDALLKQHGYK